MELSLAALSPATNQMLKRVIKSDELSQLSLAFAEAIALSGLDYPGLNRGAGVSFNPLPARLAQILMRECDERDPLILTASFYLPAVALGRLSAASGNSPAQTIALRALSDDPNKSVSEERLLLSYGLDELRHLHQFALSDSERQERALAIKTRILSQDVNTQNERLKVLVDAAWERTVKNRQP